MENSAQMKTATASLKLTTWAYWEELDELMEDDRIQVELGMCLRALISSHINKTIPPEASSTLVQIAKNHLAGGIILSDSAGEQFYDLMVFVPDAGGEATRRSFFRLIPKYPGGRFKYLNDIQPPQF